METILLVFFVAIAVVLVWMVVCAGIGVLWALVENSVGAGEWMIQSGAMAPSRYQQAVNDMDTIRTDAWLLACELREADGKSLLAGLPWNQWN